MSLMSNNLIDNLKTQHTKLKKIFSNQTILDDEIQQELKDLGIQIQMLDKEPKIVYKPVKSVYLQGNIKYRNFEKTKLCVDIAQEKKGLMSPHEQTIKNTIENYILRENQFDDSALSNYNTTKIINLINAGDVMTRENSQMLTTDLTNLRLEKDLAESPSSRRIRRDESLMNAFNPKIEAISKKQTPKSQKTNYGVKVAHRLLNQQKSKPLITKRQKTLESRCQ